MKGNKEALSLLGNAHYVSFSGVNCEKDFADFKKKVVDVFGKKAEVEAYDGENDVYVYINNEQWTTDDKAIPVIDELIDRCQSMSVNFGDCYDDAGKSVQVATLLDYLYGADICPDDHFEYDPVSELGITRKTEEKKPKRKAKK